MLRGGADSGIVSLKQGVWGCSPPEAIGYLILHSTCNAKLECFQAKFIRFVKEVNLIGVHNYEVGGVVDATHGRVYAVVFLKEQKWH